MTSSSEILTDAMARVKGSVHGAVKDLDAAQLATKPYPNGNTVAWLLWHLTRIQDDHIADAAGFEQLWTSDGWYERFGLPFEPEATGYGQGPAEVAAVQADPALLLGYHDAVSARTTEWLGSLTESDLDRVVDESWDPPVTLGVRLVSVLSDNLQHAGQAAYLRGLLLAR
ncbi:mycothiol transferase [Parafrigoribacterium humi]|uniref:mycothiol transferase n=1 Tax=Parafrigoribacterium humi TaxID=3144664 RepID=UPI0032EAD740